MIALGDNRAIIIGGGRMKKKLPTPQKLPSGMYRCQVMVNGKLVSVVDESPTVAQAKAVALKNGLIEKVEERKAFLSLSNAIDEYIKMKEGALSPSTVRGYEIVKKNRFRDLMQKDVRSITKATVQAAVSLEAQSVSPKTVYNAYGLIRPVLKEYGVDVFGVKLPQRIKPNKRYLQPEDVGKLIDAAKGDPCEIEILIAVWLGMRRSEIMGLCWDCVNFESGTLTVRRTMVPGKDNKYILRDGAKNECSQRTVSCPAYIMDKLKDKHKHGEDGLVFHGHPDNLRKRVHSVCKKAGITDTTVHGLRHTNAAVMKSLGVDDAHAMARGGWKTETTYKQTYSYIFDERAKSADGQIDDFFEKLHTDFHTDS